MRVDRKKETVFSPWRMVVTYVLIGVLLLPIPAHAAWRSRADELPGLVSGKSIAILAAAGGGAIVTLLLLKKRSSHHRPEIGMDVGPSRLDFGKVPNGQSADQVVIVTNSMHKPVTINAISLSGESFSLSSAPKVPLVLSPGERADVTVKFDPSSPRKLSGKVNISAALEEGKPKSWKISLKGKGVDSMISESVTESYRGR